MKIILIWIAFLFLTTVAMQLVYFAGKTVGRKMRR